MRAAAGVWTAETPARRRLSRSFLLFLGACGLEDDGTRPPAHPVVAEDSPDTLGPVREGEAFTTSTDDWFRGSRSTRTYNASLEEDGSSPDWLVLDAHTGQLSVVENGTDDADVGLYTLTVTASTGDASQAAKHSLVLTIANVPEPPRLTATPPRTLGVVSEGQGLTVETSVWFTDPDLDNTPLYRGSLGSEPLPGWLTLDPLTGGLTLEAGATNDAQVGTHVLTITLYDGAAEAEVFHRVALTIENINEPPYLSQVVTQSLAGAREGLAFRDSVRSWFIDPDTGDRLVYTGSLEGEALPDWLSLDPDTGEIKIETGATDDAQVGFHALTITATDSAFEKDPGQDADRSADSAAAAQLGPGQVTHTVTLTVENVNDAPEIQSSFASALEPVPEGKALDITISSWFTDQDAMDTLTYTGHIQKNGQRTVQTLETVPWVNLDSTTGVLSIPEESTDDVHVGTYSLGITASDGQAEASLHRELIIENVNEPPFLAFGLDELPDPIRIRKGAPPATRDVSSWFADPDEKIFGHREVLTYSGFVEIREKDFEMVDWIDIDKFTGVLTVFGEKLDVLPTEAGFVQISAHDSAGQFASHTAALVIYDL